MTTTGQESLRAQLAALHAHRLQTMKPEDLKVNVDQRQLLVDTADRDGFVAAGDVVAPFTLTEVDGEQLTLEGLTRSGPVVLIFFRFAGCPACNIALPYYQRRLAAPLRALGATLVAVSPQVPERLVEIKRRHELGFLVATDADNALGRRFGILYSYSLQSQAAAQAKGNFIGDVTGTGTWELPMPAVVVIGRDRTVHFADVSPDWLVRTEADPILEVVADLTAARAA